MLKRIPQNYLVVQNDRSEYVTQLAAEQISVENGNWRVNPDGTMDTTWKIRPNIKWHDGTPFTSADLLFALNLYKDPEILNRSRSAANKMESASTPDPLTFVVHWSEIHAQAGRAPGLEPLPKHLLEETYQKDKANFVNSPFFRTGYVGLGPYRLANWEQGSHFEFVRFDDYYLGRPPLDRVIVKIIPDSNTMVAALLSGSLDAMANVAINIDTAVEIKQRWEGTGNQVLFSSSGSVTWLDIQHRPDIARPANGLTNTTVRQAFFSALDRDALLQVTTLGFGQVADSWIHPTDASRAQFENSIRKYPYSPTQAQQLLAQAGWTRGVDGILIDQQSGERFEVELRGIGGDSLRQMSVIGDYWRAVGAAVSLSEFPEALTSNNELRVKFSGATTVSPGLDNLVANYFNSRFNAAPENRWTGNRAGYVSPKLDVLSEKVAVAIAPRDAFSAQSDLLQEVTTSLPIMPLYWGVTTALTFKGVEGIKGRDAWNFQEWDKR